MEMLPLVLSELIDIAVRDGMWLESNPKFKWDMNVWLCSTVDADGEPVAAAPCRACMAGAVMVRTLECDATAMTVWEPEDIDDEDTQQALLAINDFRAGDFREAQAQLRYQYPYELAVSEPQRAALEHCEKLVRVGYEKDGKAPWETYTECARILREVGL